MIVNGLIFGLISTLHCAGMCGPLALMLPQKVKQNKMQFAVLYQLGRISTYIGIGTLVFVIGVSFNVFKMQQNLSLVLGIWMLLFAIASFFKFKTPINFPFKKILNKLNQYLLKGNQVSAFVLGVVNGLLPCGAIYIAALYCVSFSNWLDVFFYMFLFGIGTLPVFIGAWLFVGKKLSFAMAKFRWIYKALPILVGVLMILRGLNLGVQMLSPELSKKGNSAEVSNCCKKE
jgi:sulfite exporter TauE/SafE